MSAFFTTIKPTPVGDLEALLALAGRLSDITIVDKPERNEQFAERAFDAAVFSTGRPVLVVPAHVPDDLLRHLLIAWNGSLEAARVIGQSIDLLHQAERVSIIMPRGSTCRSLHPPASPITCAGTASWLIVCRVGRQAVRHPGEAILAEAARNEATMLVMGAYTHSRIPHFLLGGVTRHVLEHATIPVLMAH